jgi:Cys-tRNA(Pro)/Cys-tRNA(Cys) deacylase
MKKPFPTYMDWTAEFFETVFVSAGRVGCQIELAPADLIREAKCELAELTVD